MRKLVDYEEIKNNSSFWVMFLASNFPESLDDKTDKTLSEIMSDNYSVNREWVDNFTGYYEEVFTENDGYIEDPNTLIIKLSTSNSLFIEFHPGDTIYFIDDNEIGCTGPEYVIRKINWTEFCKYTETLSSGEKILLLPMLAFDNEDQELLQQVIYEGLRVTGIKEADFEIICNAIMENSVAM